MKPLLLPLLSVLALAGFRPAPPVPAPDRPVVRHALVQASVLDRDTGEVLASHPHQGQLWVAGERGHAYAVRLRNATGQRVLVVLSVDGVNAVSGEQAAPDQTGYVLDAWESTDITGWRKSNEEVAQFVFSAPRDSYASRTGRAENLGVIGIAVFRDGDVPRWTPRRGVLHAPMASAEAVDATSPAPVQVKPSAASRAAPAPAPTQRLGTAHGERESSPVRDTAFERATVRPEQVTTLRYDSAANLRARGIVASAAPQSPEAFPGRFVPDPPAR